MEEIDYKKLAILSHSEPVINVLKGRFFVKIHFFLFKKQVHISNKSMRAIYVPNCLLKNCLKTAGGVDYTILSPCTSQNLKHI